MDKQKTLTIPETARVLGISERLAYRAARMGEIPAIRIGRRYVVPEEALSRYLSGQLHFPNS
jgi:excisionase family DNA binding protein